MQQAHDIETIAEAIIQKFVKGLRELSPQLQAEIIKRAYPKLYVFVCEENKNYTMRGVYLTKPQGHAAAAEYTDELVQCAKHHILEIEFNHKR